MSADGAASEAATSATAWDSLPRRALQPIQALLIVYFGYFAIVYSRIWGYVLRELLGLSTNIIGFVPSLRTVGLYVYAAVVLVFGALLGAYAASRLRGEAPLAGLVSRLTNAFGRLRRADTWFYVAIAGWSIAAVAIAVQSVASQGISLTDIGSRWFQSPIFVGVAMSQIFFVPMLVVTARRRWQQVLTGVFFVLSVIGLSTLGARNIPAKAVVSTLLAIVYVAKPKQLMKLALVMLLVLGVTMGVVGAISKKGIYRTAASSKLVLALTYSDSVGTVYNLDRIVRLTPPTGLFRGQLLLDSALAGVPKVLYPGRKPEYANFQIGRYLGGRQFFYINDERIDRGVSLAATLLGNAYADAGVPGVVFQMVILGLLLGYLQVRSRTEMWIVPFLVTVASFAINGVNVGVQSPHALFTLGLAACVLIVDVLAGRRGSAPAEARSEA